MQKNVLCPSCPKTNCLIKFCSVEWQEKIAAKKSMTTYPKGQYVFMQGAHVMGVFFIYHGKVKVVSSNESGKEQIVRLAGDGHMLGHGAIGQESYPIGVVTMEQASICFVDNQTIYDAFMENPRLTYHTMMFYSTELRKSEMRTKYFAQMTTEEKIIYSLIYMAETFGVSDEQRLNLILTRQDIGDIVGTSAEQVSRTVSYLKDKGYIATHGKTIQFLEIDQLISLLAHYHVPDPLISFSSKGH